MQSQVIVVNVLQAHHLTDDNTVSTRYLLFCSEEPRLIKVKMIEFYFADADFIYAGTSGRDTAKIVPWSRKSSSGHI